MSKIVKTASRFVQGGVLGVLMGGGGKKGPVAQAPAARDEVAMAEADAERLRKRRGGAADMLTGTGGAEAGSGAKFVAGN